MRNARIVSFWLASTITLFYNTQDLAVIASAVQAAQTDAGLAGPQRTAATRAWNNGLSGWASAPAASVARREGDAGTKAVTINQAQLTLTSFRSLLTALAPRVNPYLVKLASDMGRSSGAIEQ